MIHLILRTAKRILNKRSSKSSRSHFYFNRIYFRRITYLYETFKKKKELGEVWETKELIQPLGLKFSSSSKEVLKSLEKPSFIYNNKSEAHNHIAILIRQTISNISLLVQVQFYNDQLFFIGLDISKNIKNEIEKTEIINTIINKYLNKPHKTGEEFPVIEDQSGNFIFINDDVNFSICYMDSNFNDAPKNIRRAKEASSIVSVNEKDKEGKLFAF